METRLLESASHLLEDDPDWSSLQNETELKIVPMVHEASNLTTDSEHFTIGFFGRFFRTDGDPSNISHFMENIDIEELFRQSDCSEWNDMSHGYLQLTFILFLLASCLPVRGQLSYLATRTALVCGGGCGLLWALSVECTWDISFWSLLIIIINTGWLIGRLCSIVPVKLDKRLENVYTNVFEPLKVSRQQFKMLISEQKCIKQFIAKERVIEERYSRVDSLSLVLSGRFTVSQEGKALHTVTAQQFLDSPEWFGVPTDHYFQVSVTAVEDGEVLIWHRDKLKFLLMTQPFLQAVMDNVIGRDVVKKLLQVQGGMFLGDHEPVENSVQSLWIKKKENSIFNSVIGSFDMTGGGWRLLGKITEAEECLV